MYIGYDTRMKLFYSTNNTKKVNYFFILGLSILYRNSYLFNIFLSTHNEV